MECVTLLIRKGEEQQAASLSFDNDDVDCRIELKYGNVKIVGEGNDFFDALCAVRLELEKHGQLLHCYGASVNVFPSGMSRSMGKGLKAYSLTLGEPARMQDLVRIVDTGPDIQPATVAEQREFFDSWRASLG